MSLMLSVGATLVVAHFGQAQDLPLRLVDSVGAILVVAHFGQAQDLPLRLVDSVGAILVVAQFCPSVYRAGTRPAPTYNFRLLIQDFISPNPHSH